MEGRFRGRVLAGMTGFGSMVSGGCSTRGKTESTGSVIGIDDDWSAEFRVEGGGRRSPAVDVDLENAIVYALDDFMRFRVTLVQGVS